MINTIKIFLFTTFVLLLCITKSYSQTGWINTSIGVSDYKGIFFPSKDTGYALRNDGIVLKSVNSGSNWTSLNTNSTNIFVGSFTNSNLGVILSIPAKLTTNGGMIWNTISNGFNSFGLGYITGIIFINETMGFAIGGDFYPLPTPCCQDGTINKTTNSGMNWVEIYRAGGLQPEDIKFKDENNIIVLERSGFIQTTNAGMNWNYSSVLFDYVRFFSAISMTDPFKDTIYVGGYISGDTATILKSTDRGSSWFKSLQLPYHSRFRKIFFLDNNLGYAVGDTGLIVRTSNGGQSWTVQNSGTRKRLNGISFINKDTGFVVGDSGLVLKTYTGGILVNINSEYEIMNNEFTLFQNFPNPFNPSTTISYGLKSENFIQLKIYDISGRDIATLVEKNQKPGNYDVHLEGKFLPSGIYFYALFLNGKLANKKKMIILK